MKIRSDKSIRQNVYLVEVKTEAFSETDLQLMQKFGEPEVNVGGTIPMGQSNFSLPAKNLRVRSDFPYTARFDGDALEDAAARANAWRTEMESRIQTAITALRANSDTFTAESVTNV